MIQLERILDDVYNGKANAEDVKKAIEELSARWGAFSFAGYFI